MRIRESASVLLIIGSAVVGPIEARCAAGAWVPEPTPFASDGPLILGTCKRIEPIAETCARAMKEIGLEKVQAGVMSDGRLMMLPTPWRDPSTGRARMSGEWYYRTAEGRQLDLDQVRCIPAPSGLKR